MDDQLRKYRTHKQSAVKRGIEFDMSFQEWKDIWAGKYHLRGVKSGQLGMLRTRDEGGYTPENVRLGTPKENQQEAAVCEKVKTAQNWSKVSTQGFYKKPPTQTTWVGKRNYVFDEYVEEDG